MFFLVLGLLVCGAQGQGFLSRLGELVSGATSHHGVATPLAKPLSRPSALKMAPASLPTIAALAASNPNLSILLSAVKAAGLADTLSSPTADLLVFAPTNAAFGSVRGGLPCALCSYSPQLLKALNKTSSELLGDKSLLKQVLTYHVVSGGRTLPSSPVTVTTLEGETLRIDSSTIVAKRSKARVVTPNVAAAKARWSVAMAGFRLVSGGFQAD